MTTFCKIVPTRMWITALLLGMGAMQAQTLTVLHAFSGADGASPVAGVLRDASGNLYGSTGSGGAYGWGTIFKIDSNNVESVLYSFTGGTGGGYPTALLLDKATGNLYGTESGGCDCYELGTVFKVDPAGKYAVLYAFTGGSDGSGPEAGLVRDAAGNLYGTTYYGGDLNTCVQSDDRLVTRFARPPMMWPPNGCGTIFKLTPAGKHTVLYRFGTAGGDGAFPAARLIRDAAGNLYGTTSSGGYLFCPGFGCGTVFKLSTTRKQTVLYRFRGNEHGDGTDGAYPLGALSRDANGDLYGTASGGYEFGAVFKVNASGETILHTFTGTGSDGATPDAALIQDTNGNLYGTTSAGGVYGYGTVFMLDATGTETILYSFTGGTDGSRPVAALIRDANGNLYGTTSLGGDLSSCAPNGCGTVFEIAP
jgi:uncharacterized repeat protein (TIGR03803 family)